MKITTAYLEISGENPASKALAKKTGFIQKGETPIYEITEEEFLKRIHLAEDEDKNLILIENETEINVRVYYSRLNKTNNANSKTEQSLLSK